ncbi:hypothetical protein CSV86_013480 [Pseudomonas putida CSV86]|uniref:Uncharacterized protein n=2 Tax=Pseudomonas TaxID=286 RepID=A0A7K4EER1_9PSED|nr:hypothetical protein [Pseudomonas bharatica CSV86]
MLYSSPPLRWSRPLTLAVRALALAMRRHGCPPRGTQVEAIAAGQAAALVADALPCRHQQGRSTADTPPSLTRLIRSRPRPASLRNTPWVLSSCPASHAATQQQRQAGLAVQAALGAVVDLAAVIETDCCPETMP